MYLLLLFAAINLSFAFIPSLPPYWFIALCLIMAAILWWRAFIYGAVICFAIAFACMRGYWILQQQLPESLQGKDITLVGAVVGLPYSGQGKQRFQLVIHKAKGEGGQTLKQLQHKTVQLSWYKNTNESLNTTAQCWELVVRLRSPRGLVNPAGFDYQGALLRRGIYATGYVRQAHPVNSCAPPVSSQWRQWIYQQLDTEIQQPEAKGPLIALLLGDTQWLSSEQWQLLKSTGTSHLVAISGLHIGLAATIGFLLGRLLMHFVALWSIKHLWYCYFPSVFSMAFALFYSVLAGMSLPTQRALAMIALFHCGLIFYRRVPMRWLITGALFCLSLSDPLAPLGAGFWLSLLAVMVLWYGFAARSTATTDRFLNYFPTLVRAQYVLFIGLLPVSLLWFQGLSVSSFVANLVAVTVVSLWLVPGLFLWLLLHTVDSLYANTLLFYLEQTIAFAWNGLAWIEQSISPFWYVPSYTPTLSSLFFAGLGLLWLLAPKGIPYRYLGCLGLLPLLWPVVQKPALELTILDVGQGTAVVLSTPEQTLVYDTGAQYSERFSVGSHIIAPFLRSQARLDIEHLLVSHSDSDHAGGVAGLLREINVGKISTSQPEALKHLSDMSACFQGQQWQWQEITFEVLWPPLSIAPRLGTNNASCVLLIQFGSSSILLAGDIEKNVERYLLAHYGDSLANIDILLVPHHGSKTSSSEAWVAHLKPHWAVVSAGYRNRYNHPHPDIVERYQRYHSLVLNTAHNGALRFSKLNSHSPWNLERWREDYRHYWYQ